MEVKATRSIEDLERYLNLPAEVYRATAHPSVAPALGHQDASAGACL